MPDPTKRLLRVFLCHASQDKPAVHAIYKWLKSINWIDPWLDELKLLPGQNWDLEILSAIRDADAIIVCLSKESVAKEGYVQKEFKRALDLAEEKSAGTIYIIPLRLDDCIPPMKFQQWQWVDYFSAGAQEKLQKSLRLRFNGLLTKVETQIPAKLKNEIQGLVSQEKMPVLAEVLDLYKYIKIKSPGIPYLFWIGKYPVTNRLYERFLKSDDFFKPDYWTGFLKFDKNQKRIGDWKDTGLRWLKEQIINFPPELWTVEPKYWDSELLGKNFPDNPVVGINWFEANAYCMWLKEHWYELPESQANPDLIPDFCRLPLTNEWEAAAGGIQPLDRLPWDSPGNACESLETALSHGNFSVPSFTTWVSAREDSRTTPVFKYLSGKSPFGVMDMAGNVYEWQANFGEKNRGEVLIKGGSNRSDYISGVVASSMAVYPFRRNDTTGFRVFILPR
jgi:formylglycine-generating enzyme required for sulfatase activity